MIAGNKTPMQRHFILTSMVVSFSLFGDALLYAVLPSRPNDFGVMIWQIGILLGVNRFVRLLTNEIAARLIKKVGSRKPMMFSIVIGALTTMGYAVPLGFWWLLFLRIVWGACWSVLRAEGYLSAITYSKPDNRGRVIGVYQTITRAGSGGGVLIGGFLTDWIGISYTFFIYGLVTMAGLSIFLSTKTANERDSIHGKELKKEKRIISKITFPALLIWYGGLSIVLVEQMIVNLTGRIVADSVIGNLNGIIGAASLTGILLGFRSVGMLVMGPGFGALGDIYGRDKLLKVSLLAEVTVLLLMVLINGWIAYIILLILFIFFCTSNRVGIYALMGEHVSSEGREGRKAIHINRFATFIDIGMFLGPVTGFYLYERSGFVSVGFLAISLMVPLLFGIITMKIQQAD